MGNKRILVVDYDPKSLSHTRELLQTAGFDVETCADGLSALDNYKTSNPDLVLLSPMIPKMHGFEVCSNIRKMPGGDKTPIVIITDVYKGKRYRLDAIKKYGATEYIEKPIEDANLLSILQNLIQGNGSPVTITPLPRSVEEEDDQSTVQFSSEDIKLAIDSAEKAINEKQSPAAPIPTPTATANPIPTPAPAPVKKPEKARVKDDIDKRLEESLAGLSLDFYKVKSKPKPAAAAKPAPQPVKSSPVPVQPVKPQAPTFVAPASTVPVSAKPAADATFTSEDLFTDVIASVERELEHEKIITSSGVKQKTGPTTNPVPVVESSKPPEPSPKKSSFDEELERKISDTLSGILKDKGKVEPAVAKPAEPPATKAEEPAQPTIQLLRNEIESAIAAVTASEGINFGQYLLLSKIATGGMAELFKAKRKGVEGFEKILAIKRILPHMSDNEEFITMFIDEAKLAAQLTHHNICQIFDLGKIDNSYYIAMEYVHGKDLRAVLKAARTKSKAIPAELGILITSKICSALDYAHRKNDSTGQPLNLVHRDVSPQNILITYEGDVKLVDFGIAKAATKVHVTQHGALKGKLLYMSPEQAWGKAVDRRSDIFSVCAVLYEMLAGRPLFFEDNDTEVTILEKVREARVTPICSVVPTLPKELEKILNKGLQKNPDDRYQLASELQKDLDNLFYTEGYNATSASLASFARNLFPEDWVQESGGRETLVIGKEITDQFKSKQPEKVAEKSAAAAANVQSAAMTIPPQPTKPTAPQPAVDSLPSKEVPKQTKQVAELPKAAAPIVSPKMTEPELKSEESPNVTSPTHQISSTGFRDISAPEIIPPQQTGGNFIKFLVAGIVLAAIVGGIVYFMFRPQTRTNTQQNAPQQTQNPQVSSTSTESKTPQASTQKPVTSANPSPETEQQKAALLKLMEEQKKKDEALKEEQKKKDDQAKLDQQKKLEEQKKLDDVKKKEDEARAEELKKAEAEKALEEQQQKEAAAAEQQAQVAQVEQQQPPPVAATEQPPAEPATETPQQPVVNEGDLVELAPDVSKPVLIKKIEADYPPVARQKKVEGTVILGLLVDENGQVSDVQILRPAGGSSGLNESAVSAVRKWTFRPAVKAGKRVKVRVTYPVVFKLK